MVNVYKHVSFTRLISSRIRVVISTMVLMVENLSGCSIHKNSFRNRHHEQDTQFSNHIWQLKYKDINFTLKWEIAAYASACRCVSTRCDHCLTEKYVIVRADQKNLLNKRPELIANCHHKNKNILKISHNS